MNTAAKIAPYTLEQQRAQRAWNDALAAQKALKKDEFDKYVNLTKSLPALIMNSGLMPVMAFCHEKGMDKKTGQPNINDRHTWVAGQLRAALHQQFSELPEEFQGFMKNLMQAKPASYQAVVSEAFLILRWMRQMAAALPSKKEGI
ncbi:MAG: type III-B CRISPR module-associated protein Cmr5 [Hydrogenophaga sp.]|nr:type III-B CRISPR module-associated protein Cmr5 [Hydrogenophaga sp.]